MLNEHNSILQLLDVLDIKYENNTIALGKERTFYAVSLRKRAKTNIVSKSGELNLGDRSLVLFPPNTPYTRKSTYDDMIVLHFYSSLNIADKINEIKDFNYDFMLEKFEKALSVWNSFCVERYYKASAILYEIIAEIYKNSNKQGYSEKMLKAIHYIKDNLHNPDFSVNDIAAHLNICPTAMRTLFHNEAGCSPKQFVINTRMSEALSLLNGGYLTITQIAENLGFSDQKNFSTAFKKHFGYSPSKQKYNY